MMIIACHNLALGKVTVLVEKKYVPLPALKWMVVSHRRSFIVINSRISNRKKTTALMPYCHIEHFD